MSRELKGYALRHTRRPMKPGALFSAVQITGEDGKPYYCYVSFSDMLVKAVGLKMPRGISEQDPAYLSVQFVSGVWQVYACYMKTFEKVLMWATKDSSPPGWVRFYKPKGM